MSAFNVVGTLYVPLMKRFVRRWAVRPTDMERAYASGGRYRPKRAVVKVFSYYCLEICLLPTVPGAVLGGLSRLHGPAGRSGALLIMASILAAIPAGLIFGILIWAALPGTPTEGRVRRTQAAPVNTHEKHHGRSLHGEAETYYANPVCLTSASAIVWTCFIVIAPLKWAGIQMK